MSMDNPEGLLFVSKAIHDALEEKHGAGVPATMGIRKVEPLPLTGEVFPPGHMTGREVLFRQAEFQRDVDRQMRDAVMVPSRFIR